MCIRDRGGPAVVLGFGGDRLVLGGELQDRPPPYLLRCDRLVHGELRPGMMQHPVEHPPGCLFHVFDLVRVRVRIVRGVGRDVGEVRVLAAGQGDVQVLARQDVYKRQSFRR